jgi:CBS domain-containing protein
MLVQALVASPVIAINSSASIAEAAKLMLDNHISGLPVVDANGTLAGIVSESDFLRRGELQTERQRSWLSGFLASPGKVADEYVRAHGRKVGEVMSSGVITISSQASVSDAVDLMERQHIKRLPVKADGKLVGIVTRSDLLRALLNILPDNTVSPDDEKIQAVVLSELNKLTWSRNGFIHVNVANGTVELSGAIFDEGERAGCQSCCRKCAGCEIRHRPADLGRSTLWRGALAARGAYRPGISLPRRLCAPPAL